MKKFNFGSAAHRFEPGQNNTAQQEPVVKEGWLRKNKKLIIAGAAGFGVAVISRPVVNGIKNLFGKKNQEEEVPEPEEQPEEETKKKSTKKDDKKDAEK